MPGTTYGDLIRKVLREDAEKTKAPEGLTGRILDEAARRRADDIPTPKGAGSGHDGPEY